VLAEVNNTYGGRRLYWLHGTSASGPLRATTPKTLYVSPFMELEMDYEFVLTEPHATLVAHMNVTRAADAEGGTRGAKMLDATLLLSYRPWTAGEIRSALLRFPVMTAKVTAAIHWQALRLYLKGLPVIPFPQKGWR
jgi:DUF1365 family protein